MPDWSGDPPIENFVEFMKAYWQKVLVLGAGIAVLIAVTLPISPTSKVAAIAFGVVIAWVACGLDMLRSDQDENSDE